MRQEEDGCRAGTSSSLYTDLLENHPEKPFLFAALLDGFLETCSPEDQLQHKTGGRTQHWVGVWEEQRVLPFMGRDQLGAWAGKRPRKSIQKLLLKQAVLLFLCTDTCSESKPAEIFPLPAELVTGARKHQCQQLSWFICIVKAALLPLPSAGRGFKSLHAFSRSSCMWSELPAKPRLVTTSPRAWLVWLALKAQALCVAVGTSSCISPSNSLVQDPSPPQLGWEPLARHQCPSKLPWECQSVWSLPCQDGEQHPSGGWDRGVPAPASFPFSLHWCKCVLDKGCKKVALAALLV